MFAARVVSSSRCFSRQRRELLGLKLLRERVDDLVEVAVHYGVDLVERQIDPVIGHAALRKVVRANALAPIARPDQALAVRGFLLLALLALLFDEARSQHRHRLRAIAMLRAIVLALDDD